MSSNSRYGSPADDQQLVDDVDVADKLIRSSRGNSLLENTNLGTGHYSEDTLWQQVRSYRKGLFAYTAFANLLTERAIEETKMRLGREGFRHYNENKGGAEFWEPLDEDDIDELESSWTAEYRRGEEIWQALHDAKMPLSEEQIYAVMDKANVEPGHFLPVYWQMATGRHDASKSLGAELLRDVFSDMKHVRDDAEGEDTKGLLSRGGLR